MLMRAVELVNSLFFQLAYIAIISASIGTMIFVKFRRFNSNNPQPGVYGIQPTLIQEATKSPPIVQCGIYINEFSEFSIITNNFVADLFVWFIFRPSRITKDAVEGFTFEKADVLTKEKHESKFIGDKLFVQYKVRIRFSSTLNFRDFPFDDHRLYITLINDKLTPEELHFNGSVQTVRWNPDLNISGWRLIDIDVNSGYKYAALDQREGEKISYPCVTFSLDFKRKGVRQASIVIMPMLGMFLVAYFLMTFSFKNVDSNLYIVNFVFGTIMGLLAYRFVLETMSPKVGYFTLSDHIFFIFLTIVLVVYLLRLYLLVAGYPPATLLLIDAFIIIVIPIILFLMFFAILHARKIFRRKK